MNQNSFYLIAGPCMLEGKELALEIAQECRNVCFDLGIGYVFKASYDKANRTSLYSARGPGLREGLRQLALIKASAGVSVLTDVHAEIDMQPVAEVVDVIQIPAFLCAARTGKPTNIKKGQWLTPHAMHHVAAKFRSVKGHGKLMFTERGSMWGPNALVVDMYGLRQLYEVTGAPIIFDATHSVQIPGGQSTQGRGHEATEVLARAAVAVGIQGLFMEVHPNPAQAKSDAATVYPLAKLRDLLRRLVQIDRLIKVLYGSAD
jgi:2-dehydro-3-deoxyphosphooctonate aldolase (KDO 8-P synthase)